jgi:ribonuclease-3
MEQKIRELEKNLGYRFKDQKHLIRALTHPTFSEVERKKPIGRRECPHQQICSTLGDAILKAGLILILMERKIKTKGDITKSKTNLEKNMKLASVGERLNLLEEGFIKHKIGGEEEVQRAAKKVRADTIEAIVGAIYVDSNWSMKKTKRSIEKIFAKELESLEIFS